MINQFLDIVKPFLQEGFILEKTMKVAKKKYFGLKFYSFESRDELLL